VDVCGLDATVSARDELELVAGQEGGSLDPTWFYLPESDVLQNMGSHGAFRDPGICREQVYL
jgi:hypothetical protein